MSVKQISVFLENKPGALLGMTNVLGEHGIDMRAFSLAETSDFGIARFIVDDLYKTTTVLRDEGFVHSITPVVAAAIPDVPGGLNQVLRAMSDEGVNIEYMYAFLGGKKDAAYMIFRVADADKATDALKKRGIRPVEPDELANL